MTKHARFAALALAAVAWPGAASAQPQENRDKVEVAEPDRTARGVDKRFYVRLGPLHMLPNADSDEVQMRGVEGTATLAIMDGPIAGSSTDIGALTVPAAIVGARWAAPGGEVAVETILALPVTLKLRAGGTLADESIAPTVLDGIQTGIPALGSELGETKALPPTITAVYRYALSDTLHPYVGAGVSYLYTYDGRITNPVLTEVAEPSLDIENGWSGVAQAGLDLRFNRFSVVFDVKYMTGFSVQGDVTDIYVRSSAFPLYEAVHVGDATLDVQASPLIFHAGAGFDF